MKRRQGAKGRERKAMIGALIFKEGARDAGFQSRWFALRDPSEAEAMSDRRTGRSGWPGYIRDRGLRADRRWRL